MRADFSSWRLAMCAVALCLGLAAAAAVPSQRSALLLRIDGAIGPATADYLRRGFAKATARQAAAVVLQMDTPGGLDTSMREIIRDILASPVPVLTFVTPSGARAASAGTYILYASHVAAMTPGTNLGAATPVSIGGGGAGPDDDQDKGAGNGAPKPSSAGERKAINDAAAFIRGLAALRGRNAEWAERAVREAASLPAQEAAELNVIDLLARDVDDLLAQSQGRVVSVAGAPVILQTAGLAVERLDPDWRTRLLAAITNPNLALILLMIGFYGLVFEFMNPGALLPGTVGAICLLIGLYALAALPVNYAGLGLIVLGIGLITAEAVMPSFGVLGVGGGVALILGATILIDIEVPGFELYWPVIVGIGLLSLGFAGVVARLALTSRRRPVVSGREQLVGGRALVQDWSGEAGHVAIEGERWRAVASEPLRPGQRVRVVRIDGLTLSVAAEEPDTPLTEGLP